MSQKSRAPAAIGKILGIIVGTFTVNAAMSLGFYYTFEQGPGRAPTILIVLQGFLSYGLTLMAGLLIVLTLQWAFGRRKSVLWGER